MKIRWEDSLYDMVGNCDQNPCRDFYKNIRLSNFLFHELQLQSGYLKNGVYQTKSPEKNILTDERFKQRGKFHFPAIRISFKMNKIPTENDHSDLIEQPLKVTINKYTVN